MPDEVDRERVVASPPAGTVMVMFPLIVYGTSTPCTPRPSDRRYDTSYRVRRTSCTGTAVWVGFFVRTDTATSVRQFTTVSGFSASPRTSERIGAPSLMASIVEQDGAPVSLHVVGAAARHGECQRRPDGRAESHRPPPAVTTEQSEPHGSSLTF